MHAHEVARLTRHLLQRRAVQQARACHELDTLHLFRFHLSALLGRGHDRVGPALGLVGRTALAL